MCATYYQRVPFHESLKAYQLLSNDKGTLGILLTYEHAIETRHNPNTFLRKSTAPSSGKAVVGFVGAGNYASRVLIPAFQASGAILHSIASISGTNAVLSGRRNKFTNATSDTDGLIVNPDINTVASVTRHIVMRLTVQALRAGKHVFVEKPLALNHEELEEVKTAYAGAGKHLMVGLTAGLPTGSYNETPT